MLKIEPVSAKIVDAGIDAWLEETEKRVTDTFRGLGVALFNYVVFETPQWSGNAASNWNLRYGYASDDVDYDLKIKHMANSDGPPSLNVAKIKGDPEAMSVAKSRNEEQPSNITGYGLDIFITNASKDFSGESYIGMLEENPNEYLRPLNEPGHMVRNGVAKATSMFTLMPPSLEARLKSLRLGDQGNAGLR